MKKSILLLLIVVLLATTASAASAKPGESMALVCWVNNKGEEQWAYFMMTGSGIVQRYKLDGKHDIYKPTSKFVDEPDGDGWSLHIGKTQADCSERTDESYNDFVVKDVEYWHRYN